MQVNVFVTQHDGALRSSLLVVPAGALAPAAPPFGEGWRYFCTVHARDAIFGAADVEDQLRARGFAMVRTKEPSRPSLLDQD